jgi:hypothetical protein
LSCRAGRVCSRQRSSEQSVLFEAVATPSSLNQFGREAFEIEPDWFTHQHVEILEGDMRRMREVTRKSSEEGLEQNFNSLHAQREACEAFIKSQASEGWRLVKTHYDDGGVSGASMERPALQHLLGDIRQGA